MKGKLFKRLVSGALALLMLGAALPQGSDFAGLFTGSDIVASAETQGGKCGDNATWEYDSETGTLTISGTGEMYDYYAIDYFPPWYDNGDSIKKLEISEGITSIGRMAFLDLSKISDITIPSTVQTIGEQSFYNCFSLRNLKFASGSQLEFIGYDAFYWCINITSLALPEGLSAIDYGAFESCRELKSVIIPSTVTIIGTYAFSSCNAIDDVFCLVSDPSKLEWAKKELLYDHSFKPDKATICHVPIGTAAAYQEKFGAFNLTFKDDLGGKCGDNAYWLYDSDSKKLSVIGSGDMYDYEYEKTPWNSISDNISSVEIAEGITSIGEFALSKLENTEQISIPSTVTFISNYAIYFNNKLKTISFAKNSSLKTLKTGAIHWCAALESLELPQGVETIDVFGFCGCTALKTVVIPSSVTNIDPSAFALCENMEQIICLVEDPTKLTWGTGKRNLKPDKATICYVPKGTLEAYKAKFADANVSFAVKDCEITAESVGSGTVTVNSLDFKQRNADWTCQASLPTLMGKVKTENFSGTVNANIGDTVVLSISGRVDQAISNVLTRTDSAGNTVELQRASSPVISEYKDTFTYDRNAETRYRYEIKGQKLSVYHGIYDFKINWIAPSDKLTVNAGEIIQINATPDEDYRIKSLTAKDATGKAVTITDSKFITPDNDVSVTAEFEKIKYKVAVTKPTNGTLTANDTNVAWGETVTLTPTPDKGYIVKAVYLDGKQIAVNDQGKYQFVMPKNDVTVSAEFEKIKYKVTVTKPVNGTLTADKTNAAWGSTVTITPTADKGYIVKAVYLDGKQIAVNDKGKYQFEMPKNNVTVSAEFEKQPCTVVRAAGNNRFATAAAISKLSFDKVDTVIIAYGYEYADALAGIPLAAKFNAPILLTHTKFIPNETLDEIKRLGAKKAILLGGEGVISKNSEESLKKAGLTTERIAGKTRFGTAAAIAEKVSDAPEEIFFVYGLEYADALSVNPVAGYKQAPIIYLRKNGEIDADTAAYLAKVKGKVRKAYVIGGTGVISDEMMKKAAKAVGVDKPIRVYGKNRYLTCVAINEQFKDVLTGEMICVATGNNFPDALAGGMYAAIKQAPMMLINTAIKKPSYSEEQAAYLKAKIMDKIIVFGGTGVVPDEFVTALADAAGCRIIPKN